MKEILSFMIELVGFEPDFQTEKNKSSARFTRWRRFLKNHYIFDDPLRCSYGSNEYLADKI